MVKRVWRLASTLRGDDPLIRHDVITGARRR